MTKITSPDNLIEVYANFDAVVVSFARDALESVHIESFISDENASRIGFGGGHYIPARLMVYADKATEARDCLRELGIWK